MDSLQAASPSPAPSMPWYTAWMTALTRPSVTEYEALVSHPGVSIAKASFWVFLATTIGYFVSIGILLVFPSLLVPFSSDPSLGEGSSFGVTLALLCFAPFGGLLSVLGLYVSAGLSTIVAKALGGVGTFTQLVYAVAAYSAPISLVGTIIGLIPLVNCFAFLIGIYAIALNILAVKAVHRFSWGRAVLSSAVIIGLLITAVACVVVVVLALLGPAVGNVFSGIITDLGTPVP